MTWIGWAGAGTALGVGCLLAHVSPAAAAVPATPAIERSTGEANGDAATTSPQVARFDERARQAYDAGRLDEAAALWERAMALMMGPHGELHGRGLDPGRFGALARHAALAHRRAGRVSGRPAEGDRRARRVLEVAIWHLDHAADLGDGGVSERRRLETLLEDLDTTRLQPSTRAVGEAATGVPADPTAQRSARRRVGGGAAMIWLGLVASGGGLLGGSLLLGRQDVGSTAGASVMAAGLATGAVLVPLGVVVLRDGKRREQTLRDRPTLTLRPAAGGLHLDGRF